jgi:hypothetical protein
MWPAVCTRTHDSKHATRPSVDRIHADAIACAAARDARLAGADTAESATIYAAMYAAAMRGEA